MGMLKILVRLSEGSGMSFSFIDIFVAIILLLMAVVCARKGFVHSAISLFFWLLAFFLAYHFGESLGNVFSSTIDNPSIREGVGFFLIFIFMVLVGVLVTYIFSHLVEKGNLAKTNQSLGALFGVFVGAIIVAILMTFAKTTSIPEHNWWKESFFIPKLEGLQGLIEQVMPIAVKGPSDMGDLEELGPDGKPMPVKVKNPEDKGPDTVKGDDKIKEKS